MRIILALFLLLPVRVALAHEFWIEARKYQVSPGGKIEAGIYNGENFRGAEIAWFDGRIDHAGWMQGALGGGFDSRPGNRPALSMDAPGPGLVRLIYQSTPTRLTYAEWDKFRKFAESKGNGWAIDRHVARGLPETGFHERYTRFCKALVAVSDGAGSDAFTGMEAELVALSNPYAEPLQREITVEMRYQTRPLSDARIEVFEKPKSGNRDAVSFHVTTDFRGQAVLPLKPGHLYLLDSVVLREADDDDHAWESLWASLTFFVPE